MISIIFESEELNTTHLAHYESLCDAMIKCDFLLLQKTKELFCQGIKLFEKYENNVIHKKKEKLIELLMSIPSNIQTFVQSIETLHQSFNKYTEQTRSHNENQRSNE